MAYDPQAPYAIRQFEIDVLIPIEIFGVNVSFTTSAQAMITTVFVVGFFMIWAMQERRIVPGRVQTAAEMIYGFVANTVLKIAGPEAKRAIPLLFTMFVYIFFGSLIGLTPVKFTFTSHLIVTFALAMIVFTYANYLAFSKHGLGFFRFFLPHGVPGYVAPIVVGVELVSYVFRPITLSVRIFANILAGHIMIKTFADLNSMAFDGIGAPAIFLAIAPTLMMAVFYGFEVLVFAVQSYIFIVISSFYIKDALHLH